jgi:hypothetical protein
VVQHPFENYGAQREAGRATVSYKNPWLLVLDADERVDQILTQELLTLAGQGGPYDAYRMRMKNHFMDKWVKHSTLYPGWCVRLLRHQVVHYEDRSVHEYPVVSTAIGELKGHLLHYSFNKGLSSWMAKHNYYSTLEAEENRKSLAQGDTDFGGLFTLDPVRRRRSIKLLSLRMPCRPLLRFLYMYLFRRGFLDGMAGFHYCRLLYFYELLIVLKLRERSP